jgi:4-hydroxy-tetrahydrodipicolinate synthase
MASDLQLRGVYIPLITPFAADGSVALDAVTLLCHEYLDAGASGIVALGTTGESSVERRGETLGDRRMRNGRTSAWLAQLIVGAGTNSFHVDRARGPELAGTPSLARR